MAERKRALGLGRGLSALMEEVDRPAAPGAGVAMVAIAQIRANPHQPRRAFDADELADLTDSIRQRGVLQPILLRPTAHDRYEIVAGERRWRAAQAVPLHEIPAIIRTLDDSEAFEIALIENIQRADLNAIEEAEGFTRLIRDYGHTQEALAKIVGKARSHVANLLRLLDLPSPVQTLVKAGTLSMGHARALIGHADAEALARRVAAEGLSVRQTEQLARGNRATRPKAVAAAEHDPNLAEIEANLADALGMAVRLGPGKTPAAGTLTISYSALDQLDLLCRLLAAPAAGD